MLGTLGLSLFVDASDLPYYLAVGLCALYVTLALPLPSSFAAGSAGTRGAGSTGARGGSAAGGTVKRAALSTGGGPVQGRGDAALLAILTVAVPPAVYAAVHWTLLSRHVLHVYSLLLLGGGPAMLLCMLPEGLWWLAGEQHARRVLRATIMVGSGGTQ